MLTSKYVT